MAMSTRAVGRMTKPMGMECSSMSTTPSMKDTGRMINSMGKALKLGVSLVELRQPTLVTSIKERKMAKDDLIGRMALTMKETLSMGISKVLGDITLQT